VVRAQASIDIQRAPTSVYRFVAEDFERNYPRWSPEVKELRLLSSGPIRVGTLARQVRVDQGRRTESTFKITHMQPHQRLTFQGTSFPFVVDYRFDCAGSGSGGSDSGGSGTRLIFTFELRRLDLMMRPFEKLIRVAIQEGAERTVRNLKRLVEAECEPERQTA
jgi:hypothetical protein